MLPWIVRVQPSGDSSAPSVERKFDTKNEALAYIKSLGQLSLIRRVESRVYSVRPKKK